MTHDPELIEGLATSMARQEHATCFEPLHDDMVSQLGRDAFRRRARNVLDHLAAAVYLNGKTITAVSPPPVGATKVRDVQREVREYADRSVWIGPWVPVPDPQEGSDGR